MTANIFVDTNVWVYALTTKDKKRCQQAKALLCSVEKPWINGQVLRELGRVLLQKSGVTESDYKIIISTLIRTCHVAVDSAGMYLLASGLRERYCFSYWDSLIVAAALDSGCTVLYTEDMQHGQMIEGSLVLINPFVGE